MTSEAYFLAGHGCNFVRRRFAPRRHGELIPLERAVPKGVVLVTGAQCGKLSQFETICSDIYEYTTESKYKSPIENLKEFDEVGSGDAEHDKNLRGVHIHYAGAPSAIRKTYVDGNFVPIIFFSYGPYVFLRRSGIFSLREADIATIDKEDPDDCTLVQPLINSPGQPWKGTRGAVEAAYKGSLYPTVKEVLEVFDKEFGPDKEELSFEKGKMRFQAFAAVIKKRFTISMSALFSKFGKGVYYNLGCRGPCSHQGVSQEDLDVAAAPGLKLRRQRSAAGGKRRKKTRKGRRRPTTKRRKKRRKPRTRRRRGKR